MSPFLFNPADILEYGTRIETFLSPAFVWKGFAVLIGIFVLMSLIFLYHWFSYSIRPIRMSIVIFIYGSVSLVLIAAITTALTLYAANFTALI